MSDLLVKLYDLPGIAPHIQRQREAGITVRRAMAAEKRLVVDFATRTFNPGWGAQADVSFGTHPVKTFIAVSGGAIIGFASYDATFRGFFGPTGVAGACRGKGTGSALLLSCMYAMYDEGYRYAVIGGTGSPEYYEKVLNAQVIEGSRPGPYEGMVWDR